MGVPMATIIRVVKEFKAVEHRIEFVLERLGVRYYNDSKGTNPDAAIQAVKAMPGPIILIGGGYDKGSDYDEWIESFGGNYAESGDCVLLSPACASWGMFKDYEERGRIFKECVRNL